MNNLERFVTAQNTSYEAALNEIKAGRKKGHWIWKFRDSIAIIFCVIVSGLFIFISKRCNMEQTRTFSVKESIGMMRWKHFRLLEWLSTKI